MNLNTNNSNTNNTDTNTNIKMSLEQALLKIAELEANKKANQKTLTYKVSEKGAISIYGLGRFPVTLYLGQLERLIAEIPKLEEFMAINRNKLAVK